MNQALTLIQLQQSGMTKEALLQFLQTNQDNAVAALIPKSISPLNYYCQLPLGTAAGTVTFFGKNNSLTSNQTNLPQSSGTLPQGEHMVITHFRILDGNGATIQSINWAYGANLAVVKNAIMDFTRNTEKQMSNYPLSRACPDLTTDDLGFIPLHEPMLWLAQTYIEINVTTKSAPAANDSLRIEVHGIGFTS